MSLDELHEKARILGYSQEFLSLLKKPQAELTEHERWWVAHVNRAIELETTTTSTSVEFGSQAQRRRRTVSPSSTPASDATGGAEAPRIFRQHCEEEFLYLAEKNPERLVDLLEAELKNRPALLTYAAEAVGRVANTPLVIAALLPLLGNGDAVVREGAVYGLTPHLGASIVARDALRQMQNVDPSPGVIAAIKDAFAPWTGGLE